jgi:hypothetical protein
MNTDLLFDALNGVRFGLCLALVAVFGWYIFRNWDLVLRTRRQPVGVQAALAFFVYEVGESGWRGFVWLNHGDAKTAFIHSSLYLLFIAFGTIAAVGSICCLRVLIPQFWAWPTWITLLVFVGVIGLFSFS